MKDSNVRYIARYSAIRGVLIAILAAILLILAIVFFVMDLAPAGIGILVVALIAGAIAAISILRAKLHKILVYDNKVVEKQGIFITTKRARCSSALSAYRCGRGFAESYLTTATS